MKKNNHSSRAQKIYEGPAGEYPSTLDPHMSSFRVEFTHLPYKNFSEMPMLYFPNKMKSGRHR